MALIDNKTAPSLCVRVEIIEEEGIDVLQIQIPMSKTIIATSDGKIQRRRLKPEESLENVLMYPYEVSGKLSSFSQLEYSAQILLGTPMDDLDGNERDRLRNIIKYCKGEKMLLELTDEELDKVLQLVKEEVGVLYPTVTGMLLLGKEDRIAELLPIFKLFPSLGNGMRKKMYILRRCIKVLQTKPTEHLAGITIQGDYKDFYELVESIYRITGLDDDQT